MKSAPSELGRLWSRSETGWFLPAWITAGALVHLAVGLVLWLWWQFTGNSGPVFTFFDTAGNLALLVFAALESVLALAAWRRFTLEQPLFLAWGLISLAAVSRLAGVFVAHVLPSGWLRRLGTGGFDAYVLRQGGLNLAGPIAQVLLLFALAIVLSVYRGLGWSARLKRRDYAVIALFALYAARHVYEIGVIHRYPASPFALINWASDPLLLILLIEAVLLWRCAEQMGGGLVASCWAGYAFAIALTLAGDIGLWASYWYFIPWPANSLTWFIWFPAAAAYAIAPAYQFEAQRRVALLPAVLAGGRNAAG